MNLNNIKVTLNCRKNETLILSSIFLTFILFFLYISVLFSGWYPQILLQVDYWQYYILKYMAQRKKNKSLLNENQWHFNFNYCIFSFLGIVWFLQNFLFLFHVAKVLFFLFLLLISNHFKTNLFYSFFKGF